MDENILGCISYWVDKICVNWEYGQIPAMMAIGLIMVIGLIGPKTPSIGLLDSIILLESNARCRLVSHWISEQDKLPCTYTRHNIQIIFLKFKNKSITDIT
ncbi:hypothetical protein RCL_jg3693.t1 [Rhizophagus clarus]|uniref:Uncharacterized protein n=1 Tax=Rhizophagus clarus TaxID=94130 RepID=A0A8H3M561_9GLOM|nr:hypothetical protein RCL_jg3693.t1 [Rhizophagus clarus]